MRGNLVWDICAFVPSEAGLTKEVVFHEGGRSKEVHTVHTYIQYICMYIQYSGPLLTQNCLT